MKRSKQTKKALTSSVLALVLCFVMLLGTTFAWFTDNASTSVNKVQAGTLDVALEMKDEAGRWVSAEGKTLNFVAKDGNENILWEPGATYELPELRIVNKGNLALKYKVEISGINGDAKLNEVIDWYYSIDLSSVFPSGTGWTTPTEQYKLEKFGSGDYLYPEGVTKNARTHEQVFKIIGVMEKNAGNAYQGLSIDGIAITVLATQYTYESDSNGTDYDKNAEYDNVDVVAIPGGTDSDVSAAVAAALKAAPTTDATDGATSSLIVLPANTTVTIDSGAVSVAQNKHKTITFTGDSSSNIKLVNTNPGYEGKLSYQDNADLTFDGITVDMSDSSGICARNGVVTFNNCTISGELEKTIGAKFVFTNCTFTSAVSQVGYGCSDVVFDGCTFNVDGYGIKVYSESSTPITINLTVKNCKFKNTGSTERSAILIDNIFDTITYNISVESCTFEGYNTKPTATDNRWAARMIVESSFVMSGGQYVFSYQTGEESGNWHKLIPDGQLTVTVK